MAWNCKAYTDLLFDRSPHYDEDILRDFFPTDDAWMGHTLMGTWDSFSGDTHVFDRIHVAFPDESGCWQVVDTSACTGTPCAPPETTIGWGSTRVTYGKEKKSYTTNVLCFDQINSKAKAKEQFAQIVAGLKEITKMVNSNWMRTWALRGAQTLYIAGSAGLSIPLNDSTFGLNSGLAGSPACSTLVLGSDALLPTSQLTVQYLDTFYEPLQFAGYFKYKYMPAGVFKVITDPMTARSLREQNPALLSNYRFSDFQKGGEMFKFGISTAVGNYGIAYDGFPIRFQHITPGGLLQRVFPYNNVPATIGIKPQPNSAYLNAPYQISQIWHTEAMRVLSAQLSAINPEMPFLVRDLAGKWRFAGPESDALVITDPVTQTTCTIDNKRRNQGLFFADFERGVRYERPELVRMILHQRQPGGSCVVDQPVCGTPPAYVTQNYSSSNSVCLI